ncbi:DUF559 domain-containing protein [Nocardioides sp. DS6]|uniref:DUF559 domain-containing protein n=1 Tax=Nocardioides eburneus TaxID=3231482 RepID=A0ABV3SUS9_9ACTN
MKAETALAQLGGVADAAQLRVLCSKRQLKQAVKDRRIVRASRGRYVLPSVPRHRRRAAELTGVCSHLSAAQHWGWKVKWPPDRAWVTVKRNRKLSRQLQTIVHVVYCDLAEDEVIDGVTSPLKTVVDCARRLPFDEALAVADSALRSGMVSRAALIAAAAVTYGPGSAQVRRVAAEASPKAANPFESVLRAIVLEFAELSVVPQQAVMARGFVYHPDLVDVRRRLVIEAESHEFHTGKEAFEIDCTRYTALTVTGWLVLRFTWEQVMRSPAYVRDVLRSLLRGPCNVQSTLPRASGRPTAA